MRMWMINPKILCRQHLNGEHGELHKHKPSFIKQYKVDKRISPIVQIELSSFKERHDELAKEIIRRGGNHKSPITAPDFSYLPPEHYNAKVDKDYALNDLITRCPMCKERYKLFKRGEL